MVMSGDNIDARSQVEAPDGRYIVSFDYGQIRSRNVATESLDETLVQSLWDRVDIHIKWADRCMELYPGWVKEGIIKAITGSDEKYGAPTGVTAASTPRPRLSSNKAPMRSQEELAGKRGFRCDLLKTTFDPVANLRRRAGLYFLFAWSLLPI